MPHDGADEPPESAWPILIDLAAATLSAIRPDDLPGQLRRFARFAPAKRAKPAGPALRTELSRDSAFRQRVAELVTGSLPLAASVAEGTVPEDADPVEVAALAFLTRPDGWTRLVRAGARHQREQEAASEVADRIARAEQHAAAAEHDRATAEREAEKLRVELTELRGEVEELRHRQRADARELRELRRRERKAVDALSAERGRLRQAEDNHTAEVRRLTAELDETLQSLERARRGARDTRSLNDARLWLLLETIGGAAQGLRRELALEPAERPPAEFVADVEGLRADRPASASARGLEADDPIRLDELLALPRAHLIVDGYNVTKGRWGDLTLEQQRARLTRGLSGLAAQTGAEMTVVYDGAERMVGLPPAPRGVRVLFSRKGQTADEVIRALVRAEPNGRPVVVISSDREVADGTRRNGAYPLSSDTLRRRLERA
ncbi:putative RNA-binding protein with PIN domain [Stackebrandtia albiflava]|uniref:Putative RNA-binding protein with PIN domain n=1 Tax=Stackebrandtia albiflava TaxID=406432 RepID=A0A562VH16_9ACTN|nr:putative RNA-binding protein with PIN domain [Stackebrandtia albiflava]